MNAPQIIMIGLIGANVFLALTQHGKPKEGKNNFWVSTIATAIHTGLLIWGGFFN